MESQEIRTQYHTFEIILPNQTKFNIFQKKGPAPKGVDKYVIRIKNFTINIDSSGALLIILLGPPAVHHVQLYNSKKR